MRRVIVSRAAQRAPHNCNNSHNNLQNNTRSSHSVTQTRPSHHHYNKIHIRAQNSRLQANENHQHQHHHTTVLFKFNNDHQQLHHGSSNKRHHRQHYNAEILISVRSYAQAPSTTKEKVELEKMTHKAEPSFIAPLPSSSTSSPPSSSVNPLPTTSSKSSSSTPTSSSKPASPQPKTRHSLSWLSLFRYVWPEHGQGKRAVLYAMALLIGAKVLTVQVPYMFKYAVDALNGIANPLALTPIALILAYGAARAGAALFSELKNAVFARVSHEAIRTVSRNTFRHLLNLDLGFHLNRQTGGLSRIIERGTKGLHFILTAMVFNIFPTIVEISLVSGILWHNFGGVYGCVALATMVVYTIFTVAITQWRTKFRKQMNAAENEASSKSIDALINYETVKYFNNEDAEVNRYDKFLKNHNEAAIKSQSSLSLLNAGQNIIFSVALSTMMIMAANGITAGTMTIGDLVMINGLIFQLSLPLNFLGTVYREVKQALIDMEAMHDLLSLKSKIQDIPGAKAVDFSRGGEIVFDGVNFGYNTDRPVLTNLSFSIKPGQKVAFVGPSGSGKSTLLRLLFRFYEADSGKITINGDDIKTLKLDSVRKAIGVVPQDTILFNDSIYYNISYGNSKATKEEVEQAAKMAQIHDVVQSLPKQYDTQVGERGLKLSGGEKQRVAIARTILKSPQILFWDEATSSLDSRTEKEILSAINYLAKDRTTLVIAHRLSSIVDADQIFVLKNGTIAESGNHDQLMKLGGEYEKMYTLQSSSFSSGPVKKENTPTSADDAKKKTQK